MRNASLKVVFALTNQKRVQAVISSRTKSEARTKKERARNVFLDFRLQKHPVKKGTTSPGNQTLGIPASLTILQAQLLSEALHCVARDIVHGWH